VKRSAEQLRRDVVQIWRAGLAAVRSDALVENVLRVEGNCLWIEDEPVDLDSIGRIVVVGAGKAGAGMAAGFERALGPHLLAAKQVSGWINVPADCVRPLARIHLHAARPAGVNEPTEAGVAGAGEILRLVESLAPGDLCFVLLSGGGSALLPAPVAGISLADKLAVTRHLSAAGANITELNTVRKQLSRLKGGGLARTCRARRLFALIISDVLGDPLDIIASGPTVPDSSSPQQALEVLERYSGRAVLPAAVFEHLERQSTAAQAPAACEVTNLVIGNNALAVDAAGLEAERLGYSHAMLAAPAPEGAAEEVGRHLARLGLNMLAVSGPDCLVSGGEPVVTLAPPERRGKGGRNQQLVLAAAEVLASSTSAGGFTILSGGTDGEDGPTDAAGAWVDGELIARAAQLGLDVRDYLQRNDAYHYFEPIGGLLKTGPTDTNVCDVRVVVVERVELERRA
jgi:hydroxypyruvate reductase